MNGLGGLHTGQYCVRCAAGKKYFSSFDLKIYTCALLRVSLRQAAKHAFRQTVRWRSAALIMLR
jgi:hypothetical protein